MPAIKHIMAVMPYSPADDRCIAGLINLAQRCRASVSVVGCYKPSNALMSRWRYFRDYDEQRQQDAEDMLRHVENRLFAVGVEVLSTMVTTEPRFDIRSALLEQGADLLIAPAEQVAEAKGFPVSAKLQELLKDCPVPVWRISTGGTLTPKRMLLVLDDGRLCNEINQRLIAWAVFFARLMETEVHTMVSADLAADEVIHGHFRSRQINEVLRKLEGKQDSQARMFLSALEACPKNIPLQTHMRQGNVIAQVRRLIGEIDADLVLMAPNRRSPIRKVFVGHAPDMILRDLARSSLFCI